MFKIAIWLRFMDIINESWHLLQIFCWNLKYNLRNNRMWSTKRLLIRNLSSKLLNYIASPNQVSYVYQFCISIFLLAITGPLLPVLPLAPTFEHLPLFTLIFYQMFSLNSCKLLCAKYFIPTWRKENFYQNQRFLRNYA